MDIEFQLQMPSPAQLAAATQDQVEEWALDVAANARSGDDLTPAIEAMDAANTLFAEKHGLRPREEGPGL